MLDALNFLDLALTELDLLELDAFALSADDCLEPALALAHWLFEILAAFDDSNSARLLNFAVEAAKQVLCRFLPVFTCNLYHIRRILPEF